MPYKTTATRLAYHKAYYRRNRARIKQQKQVYRTKNRKWFLKRQRKWGRTARLRRYGFTSEKERKKFLSRGCAICGSKRNLQVDHDHKTGRTRSPLCRNHNMALGLFHENVEHLQRAVKYLKENNTTCLG